MKNIHRLLPGLFNQRSLKFLTAGIVLFLLNAKAIGQTFEFPSAVYVDSLSLQSIVASPNPDTVEVTQGNYNNMSGATTGSNFTIKSILALANFKVNVQSPNVGEKQKFTYVITYKTLGTTNPAIPDTVISALDTLSVTYDRDSLKLISDRAFKIAGNYHKLLIIIYDVFEVTTSGGGLTYLPPAPGSVPSFVNVYGEIYVQKFMNYSSLDMTGYINVSNTISANGTVQLSWNGLSGYTPAGYEVEWTYTGPATASVSFGDLKYDFRNNATRIFTNNTSFNIPVAQKEGYLVYRVRMVRPALTNLLARTYGQWDFNSDYGSLSSVPGNNRVEIQQSSHDDFNWDLKMNFVEDGKYKQVITYYDGLLKPKQVQTRFNSKPSQTIVAQSLYDHEGRAVINTLPIPVNGVSKFSYLSNFLHPAGASEYNKLDYDAFPDLTLCPPRETPIPALDPAASSNGYYSTNNIDMTGKNAFIPDAEGYPLVRKIFAAENSDKVLFEGQAGAALQLGNDRHTAYLYGSPLQAELNRYFGQDIGKYNYYRKMITTDNHDQDMFSITDEEGRLVASGLIGTPDTNTLALSVRNSPVNKNFQSNLLPVPNIRLDENWKHNGSYFVETDANYLFRYQIDYQPFKPCPSINYGLLPKVYYFYEVIDECGNIKLQDNGALGGIGMTAAPSISYHKDSGVFLKKGNHVWNKHSYIKLDDLSASVDYFLENTNGCFLNFNHFLKQEFIKANFPCENNYDPCASMRLSMIKEMHPLAKYGQYQYWDSSKVFAGQKPNSIFTLNQGDRYRFQANCIQGTVQLGGETLNIRDLTPQQLIAMFNDSIGAALLPLHPDYCILELCEVINNPYCKILASRNNAPQDVGITLDHIVNNDPLLTNGVLAHHELATTLDDDLSIDSIAFKRTICGSELGVIESVCSEINIAKTPMDISSYPQYIQDEYYRNLVALYTSNREERLGIKLQQLSNTCEPCSSSRIQAPDDDAFESESDTTFLVKGMDSLTKNLTLPVNSSFNNYFSSSSNINADSLENLKSFDNSVYCTDLVEHIVNTLSSCNVSQTVLNNLKDTLKTRFCSGKNSITTLSYDSLTNIMTEVGITSNDLCNAGLVDLRRITRGSSDFVQLGLLHYAPAYYEDLTDFMQSNLILDFIAGTPNSMNASLVLCDAHPFQQYLAKQLGATLTPLNCGNSLPVQIIKSSVLNSNAVKLSFTANGDEVGYFLYPVSNGDTNALNTDFGATAISNTGNYTLSSLFNLYGFDKLSASYANRNTILLNFEGTKDNVQRSFNYFLSAFNVQSDYNLMEKDEKEYLNGIGCSEFIPMAKDAIAMAEQLDIKAGHPYFEKFLQNVINYQNSVNFDFKNYNAAIQSCGLTDSIIIQKSYAHFKIKFPVAYTVTNIETYINTLRAARVGISDVQSYELNSDKYLLLKIYETDSNNIKDAKQIIQAALPGGSSLEYMPYLHKDTLAQLLSSHFNPVDIPSLNSAFPGAFITSVPVDIYYFIPGYGVFTNPGDMITIEKSITDNYDYNHYVDDICRHVHANAPMTPIFSHAESAVSAQYYDWQMTAWRDYVMSLAPDNHNELVKKSKADQFNALSASGGGSSFAASKFSYKNSRSPYYLNNLYIDHGPNSNADYNYIEQLLQVIENTNFPQTIFKPYATSTPKILFLGGGNTETRAYVCGDTTQFWINHFDANNNMINIFIKLPDVLPLPREEYHIVSISKGVEKDSITYFNLELAPTPGSAISDTIHCIAYTNKNLGETYTIPSAFLSSHSQFETLSGRFENCETRKMQTLYPLARVNYNLYKDSMRNVLVAQFRQHVIDNLQEQLSIIGNDIKHGVTLYYYDMAGNLIKTVSPNNVKELSVAGFDNDTINARRSRNEKITTSLPPHDTVTWYQYNAQNKVVQNGTPDGGVTTSQYDLMGRIVVSQNDKQKPYNEYTYFLYDDLSRVVETGIVTRSPFWDLAFFTTPDSIDNDIKSRYRREVTVTLYDTPSYKIAAPFNKLPAQENLKNRVSCTKYFDAVGGYVNASADTNYTNALHYSYDVSGNVKTLIHDLRYVVDQFLRFKRVDYEYDLYSGKVLLVSYNRGYTDQFYQKYNYDSDNRILDVHTSNNGILWDRDGHYEYYDHGPVARVQLGEQRVQGVDYAYTINGWLKAINGIQNDPQSDMGQDGDVGVVTPKDVFSQRVDYFTKDYKAIADSNIFRHVPGTPKSLYNGNIAGVAAALAPFNNVYKKYHYDPLQRIDRAEYANYSYNYSTSILNTANIADYASEYKYDADGNLLKLRRQGGTVSAALNGGVPIAQHMMDTLTYNYVPKTNRLKNIADLSSSTSYKIDIPPTPLNPSLTHYSYDATGNITQDLVSGLTNIEWNRLGKVKSILKQDGSRMYFSYDPMGNRLTKELVQYPHADSMVKFKTIYVRDATGNMLAVYEDKKEFSLERINWGVLTAEPDIAIFDGGIPVVFADALSDKLCTAYFDNPDDNLAKLAMAVSSLNDYTANASLLQNLVLSLDPVQGLNFVKSIPDITAYTLNAPDGSVIEPQKLSSYLQPVLLSENENMNQLQTDLFTSLKTNNEALYYTTVQNVPVSEGEKSEFPDNPAMLQAFKSMPLPEKMQITNMLAQSLSAENIGTLPPVADVLVSAYSNANTHTEFVQEIPGGEVILDQLKQDANNYIAYRYALPDVPLETVQGQFQNNAVLTGVLSQDGAEPDPVSLSAIISAHFGQVVTLAGNSNQGTVFAKAFRDVIAVGDVDQVFTAWFGTKEILKSQRHHLGEHHIYGSSRLGMQKYLPEEIKYQFGVGTTGSTSTNNLTATKPWYSLYGNDLFSPTLYHNDLKKANMSSNGLGINIHILGNRHYELTNHLGNVQATVLDRTTPILGEGNPGPLVGYKADISTAWDYYPFGMLMPGRYVVDESQKCVTINTTVLVPQIVRVDLTATLSPWAVAYPYGHPVHQIPKAASFAEEKLHVYHYLDASEHPGGQVVTTEFVEGIANFTIDLSNEPSGVSAYLQIHADATQDMQEVGFDLDLNDECRAEVRVRQYMGEGEEYEEALSWMPIDASGHYQLQVPVNHAAVLAGGNTLLELRFISLHGGNFTEGRAVLFRNYYTYISHYVPQTRIATICDEKDNYRFGFNGMEKDNEPKGIGNSLDFGARIHDSRLGRFLSLDPLAREFPSESNYSFAGNNPIYNIDQDGKKKTVYTYTIDGRTGETTVKRIKTDGLDVVRYRSWYSGILTYDWYDYSEINVKFIDKDGKSHNVFNSGKIRGGEIRTNTFLKSERWAKWKTNDHATKDNRTFSGWIGTSSEGGGSENEYEPNAGKGSKYVDYGRILKTIGYIQGFTRQKPESALELLGDLNSALGLAKDFATDNDKSGIINVDASTDPEKRTSPNVCPACGQEKDSAHIDQVNGAGTYEKQKEASSK